MCVRGGGFCATSLAVIGALEQGHPEERRILATFSATDLVGMSPTTNQPEGAVPQKNKEKEDSEIKWGSGLMPFAGKSPDPNPCMPFIVNIYFLISALEISVLYTLRSGLNIYNAQSSMSNLQACHDSSASDALSQHLPRVSGYGKSH